VYKSPEQTKGAGHRNVCSKIHQLGIEVQATVLLNSRTTRRTMFKRAVRCTSGTCCAARFYKEGGALHLSLSLTTTKYRIRQTISVIVHYWLKCTKKHRANKLRAPQDL